MFFRLERMGRFGLLVVYSNCLVQMLAKSLLPNGSGKKFVALGLPCMLGGRDDKLTDADQNTVRIGISCLT